MMDHQEPEVRKLLAKVKHFPSLQMSWPVSKKDVGVFLKCQLSLQNMLLFLPQLSGFGVFFQGEL